MESITEQWKNIKLCVLLKKSLSETLTLLEEVYDEITIKKQVYEW